MPLQEICVSPKEPVQNSTAAKEAQMVRVASPTFSPMDRCASQTSTLSSGHDICRICHCEAEPDAPLIAPCYCSGSLRYVHQACLQQWIKSSDTRSCELCKFHFIMHTKSKPFRKWEKLDMAAVERRKVCCSVAFHLVAITCVVWSLYVLIERTADEVRLGVLEWPFWTKLVVVAVGFTGGLVFMYIQCKMYVHLCRRWRAFNRVIYVQNAPEKAPPPPPLPYKLADKQAMVAAAAAAAALPQPDPAQTFPIRPWSQSAVTPLATAAATPAVPATPQTDPETVASEPAEPGIT